MPSENSLNIVEFLLVWITNFLGFKNAKMIGLGIKKRHATKIQVFTPKKLIISPPIIGPDSLAKLKFVDTKATTEEYWSLLETNLGPNDSLTGWLAEDIVPMIKQ